MPVLTSHYNKVRVYLRYIQNPNQAPLSRVFTYIKKLRLRRSFLQGWYYRTSRPFLFLLILLKFFSLPEVNE